MNIERDAITIRRFSKKDQDAAKRLILEGMKEHWGHIDPNMNPDLDHIAASYANDTFVVALQGGELVGTGALVGENEHAGRVLRMTVAQQCRRLGIGTKILGYLFDRAVAIGYKRIVLETTSSWSDAIGFYMAMGFNITHREGDETHFVLELDR